MGTFGIPVVKSSYVENLVEDNEEEFARYKQIRRLGQGAFGTAYLTER